MGEQKFTRRRFIEVTGVTAAGASLGVSTAAAQTGWTQAPTPTENTLYDLCLSHDDNASLNPGRYSFYAVGGEGVVLSGGHEGWEKDLDKGSFGNGNDLYGSDVWEQKDDDLSSLNPGGFDRLWVVGPNGTIGEITYPIEDPVVHDRSKPNGVTETFNDVSLVEENGLDEVHVYVASESGKIYHSFRKDDSGTWDSVTVSEAPIKAINFPSRGSFVGYAVDEKQTVFRTDDGKTWNPIGINNATHNFYGVDFEGMTKTVTVCGGAGTVWTRQGANWGSTDLGETDLYDVDTDIHWVVNHLRGTCGLVQNRLGRIREACESIPQSTVTLRGLIVGDGGKVFRHNRREWHEEPTPVDKDLKGVMYGGDNRRRDVAVGADGTIIESR